MAAGKDNLLETDVYNQEPGHAAKHNAVNEQVNWLTDQVADIGSNPDLLASIAATAVTRSDAKASGIGAYKKIREITDPSHPESSWREYVNTASFNSGSPGAGTAESVWFFGWGAQVAVGLPKPAGSAVIYMGMETKYEDHLDRNTLEWYVGVQPENAGGIFRPLYFTAGRDDTSNWAEVNLNIGADGAYGQLNILAGNSAYLAQVTAADTRWYVPFKIHSAFDQSLEIGRGNIATDANLYLKPGPGAHTGAITFYRTPVGTEDITARWRIYDGYSEDSLYVRDLENNVMLLSLDGGAGVTGMVTVGGALKVAGALGFYGGDVVTKQTVSGSRGGNAALASLLTALANTGLITNSSTA